MFDMKQRKFLSVLLALALALGLCVPASASSTNLDQTTTSTTVTFTSTLKLPTIKVTIGAATDVIVNPYKMSVTVGSTPSTESLITSPVEIKSDSSMEIKITADPKVSVDAGTDIATATLVGQTLTKPTVFMQFSMGKLSGALASNAFTPASADVPPTTITDKSLGTLPTLQLGVGSTTAQYAAFQITGETGGPNWSSTSSKVGATVTFNIEPVLGTGTAT